MADIFESTKTVRIALEDVTPVIAAVFADVACLIWSSEHRAYWVAGGNGYTTGAACAGRWTIADAYRQTKHCDPTKQIAFERVDVTRAAPPAMDREAVRRVDTLLSKLFPEWEADQRLHIATECVEATLSADAIHQGEEDGDEWLPITDDAKSGALVELVVDYKEGEHPLTDAILACTIGFNTLADTGVDEWKFAGWCWTHDHFVQGKGKPVAWRPSRLNTGDDALPRLPATPASDGRK